MIFNFVRREPDLKKTRESLLCNLIQEECNTQSRTPWAFCSGVIILVSSIFQWSYCFVKWSSLFTIAPPPPPRKRCKMPHASVCVLSWTCMCVKKAFSSTRSGHWNTRGATAFFFSSWRILKRAATTSRRRHVTFPCFLQWQNSTLHLNFLNFPNFCWTWQNCKHFVSQTH